MSENAAGAVIVISSHVVRGSVGNRAAVFALETLGHQVWALPTIVLPWHPGHGRSTRLTFAEADFEAAIDDLIRAPWIGEVKAVLSGYFGNAAQVRSVAKLVASLRERNPELLYVCDPVMGDLGGLYVPEATAEAIRDHLIPLASLATPNRYELAWLSGAALDDNNAVMERFTSDGGDSILTLAEWQQQTGQDAQSFVATPAQLFIDAASNDYRLSATSPALDSGETRADVPTDILGVVRPQGAGFDVGAYERPAGDLIFADGFD